MPPQAAKWAECSSGAPTLPYNAATIDLLRRGTALSGDTTMVHGDVRTCSRDRKTLDAVHQSARRTTRVHEGSSRGMQERAPSTRTEKVGQILDTTARSTPGFYAASSWGGYAQSKGDAPSTAHPTIPDSPRWWAVTLPGGCSV